VYGKVDAVSEVKEVVDRNVERVVTVELVEVGKSDDGEVLVSDVEELALDDEELVLVVG
jgi:hypothetical protein